MATEEPMIRTILSRWDAAGVSAQRSEVWRIYNVVTGKCKSLYAPNCLHASWHITLPPTGFWREKDIRYGDVIKIFITCQVMDLDIQGTMFNIALKLFGKDRLHTNKWALVMSKLTNMQQHFLQICNAHTHKNATTQMHALAGTTCTNARWRSWRIWPSHEGRIITRFSYPSRVRR